MGVSSSPANLKRKFRTMRVPLVLIDTAYTFDRVMETSGPLATLFAELRRMFCYPFMQNALLAGTIVALVAGVAGYFMVLRGESFAGHSLANIGFAGAAGAALLGVPVVVGLISFGILGALGMGALAERASRARSRNDAAVGAVLVLALGLGVLFERLSSAKSSSVYAILFGAPLGVASADVREIALTAGVTLLALAVIARPLLFASVDPSVAESRGAPVRLALAVAQATQVVGVLLIFALLVAPAATAQRLTARPGCGVALSVGIALAITWISLILAYFTSYPVGFFITSVALGAYLSARLMQLVARSASMAYRQKRGDMTQVAVSVQSQEARG
jgi:zinc/manganese transport system permease protein